MKIKSLSFIVASALLGVMASCSNDDIAQGSENPGNKTESNDNANLTAFVAAGQPNEMKTRTSMDYSTGDFFWEMNDKIYVKDDDGGFQTSSNAVDKDKQSAFKFMMPGKYTQDKYIVYYPGAKTKENHVVIKDEQKQTAPNDTKLFGENGDCGLAKAKKNGGRFEFKVDHMISILALQPYTSIEYITSIDVIASTDNNIAGPYTLDGNQYKLTGTGSTKTITLTTKGTGNNEHGFRLTKLDEHVEPYRAFVIIAPGEHKLTIKYHLKDIKTGTVGVITKTLKKSDYKANTIYDIKSRIDVEKYDGKVYMWDAEKHYWNGYDDVQPYLNNDAENPNYPKSSTDSYNRWYNTSFMNIEGTGIATKAAKDCPNINEILWYLHKGDPHWDNVKLWTIGGYLYKGGMWFKKASAIASENGGIGVNTLKDSYDGKDYRQGTKAMQNEFPHKYYLTNAQQTPPTDKTNYFYLPAIDNYLNGEIRKGAGYGMGLEGQYWSSTCYALKPSDGLEYNGAFNLTFKQSHIGVHRSLRECGMRCVKFQ